MLFNVTGNKNNQDKSSDKYNNINVVPQVHGSAVYRFIPNNFRTYTAVNGSLTNVDNLFKARTDGTQYSYGALQSFRSIKYKLNGLGKAEFGGYWDTAKANVESGIGLLNLGDEASFGTNTEGLFGVWHRYGGVAEVRELQVTTVASGSETATVVVNGSSYDIAITNSSVEQNAYEIAEYLAHNNTAFAFDQLEDKVIAVALSDGAKNNTFTFSSTGDAVATWNGVTTGVTKTSEFIAQANWNIGAPENFDYTKGNNYQIIYDSGFGFIKYYVSSPTSGELVLVHHIKWNNTYTETIFKNPSLRLGMYVFSPNTSEPMDIYCSGLSGQLLGSDNATRNPRSIDNTKNIATDLTNIITLRNARTLNGYANQVEIKPLVITLSNDGTKSAIFEIRGNATIVGPTNYQEINETLVGHYDITGGVSSGGRPLGKFTVAKGGSRDIDLEKLGIAIPPSLEFTIAGRMASGSAADLTVALAYYEDI